MSTNIQIDVVLQRLQKQANQARDQNRTERQDREDTYQQGLIESRSNGDTSSLMLRSDRLRSSVADQRKQSADAHSDVPDTYKQRKPAAQRFGGLWFYCRDWVSRVHRVWVSGPASGNELNYYDVHDASTVRHYLSSVSSPNTERELYTNTVPEHLFKYGGAWDVVPGLQFMNIATGGPRDFVEPPIYACAGGYIYGVARHTECWTTTPLTDDFTGDPVCTWDCRHYYVFFKINATAGTAQSKVVQENSSSTTISGWGPGYEDLLPWQAGGIEWRRIYADNAYAGDPSVSLRQQGYTGQYQVKNGKAYFAMINFTRNRDAQFESYQYHYTQQDLNTEYFYYAGNSSTTGPGFTDWDYWQNLEIIAVNEPTSLAGWNAIAFNFNMASPPQPILQRSALDKSAYITSTGLQEPTTPPSVVGGTWQSQRQAAFDAGSKAIYKGMYDYENPPADLVTAPHNPPTSYEQDQDRWMEPQLHPIFYLL
jgi:hypothetical protein